MHGVLRALGGHSVYLLLIQLAILIAAARVGAETAKRMGLPSVVGELAAGLALGPSGLGHFFPQLFLAVFPHDAEQFHLLDVVGTLGMACLLLLTGLETDVKLLRNLGRAAMYTSLTGMVLPFALGLILGIFMPEAYLADPHQRWLFALFLATSMSISAMPVIAKILVDLDLTRRNIGLVILSAGVVDDTAGWLLLSLIAGMATRGHVDIGQLGFTVLALTLFCVGAVFVLYPLLRWLFRKIDEKARTRDSDLVLMLVVMLLCGALTEKIGVHAVFGSFAAGVVMHQIPWVKKETVARFESFVFAMLAPVFFGIVGIKVNVWELGGPGMLVLVLSVACAGKLVGCSLGALGGGLRFWEAASLAVAMNARGAMEIVVATIGLSLGILSTPMFSIIVIVAVVTSFMAPIGLKLTVPRVRLTDEEQKRILAEQSMGNIDPAAVKVMLATAGGTNALAAVPLALGLARRSHSALRVLHVNAPAGLRLRMRRLFGLEPPAGDISQQLEQIRLLAGTQPFDVHKTTAADVAANLVLEAGRGFDLLLLGAGAGPTVGGAVVEELVSKAPCHVGIMKAVKPTTSFVHLFVPIDGSGASRLAAEVALRLAESMNASLTLAVVTERRPQAAAYVDESGTYADVAVRATPDDELDRISVVFRTATTKPHIVRLEYDPLSSAVAREAANGTYDLVVLGAENRAIQHRLFLGYENERLIRSARVSVLVIVPNVARLH